MVIEKAFHVLCLTFHSIATLAYCISEGIKHWCGRYFMAIIYSLLLLLLVTGVLFGYYCKYSDTFIQPANARMQGFEVCVCVSVSVSVCLWVWGGDNVE